MESDKGEKRYVATYADKKQAVFFTVDGILQATKDAIRWRPSEEIISIEQKSLEVESTK